MATQRSIPAGRGATIEPLWNPKGRAIYKPHRRTSNAFSPRLAARTKKRAARGLHDALDPATAPPAGPASAVVNPQPLLEIIRRVRRMTKVKQVVGAMALAVIPRDGAAELDGLGQHRANRAEQT